MCLYEYDDLILGQALMHLWLDFWDLAHLGGLDWAYDSAQLHMVPHAAGGQLQLAFHEGGAPRETAEPASKG